MRSANRSLSVRNHRLDSLDRGRRRRCGLITKLPSSPAVMYRIQSTSSACPSISPEPLRRLPQSNRCLRRHENPSRRTTRGHSASRPGIGGTWSALPTSRSRSSSTLRASAPLRAQRARPRRALRNIPSARSWFKP